MLPIHFFSAFVMYCHPSSAFDPLRRCVQAPSVAVSSFQTPEGAAADVVRAPPQEDLQDQLRRATPGQYDFAIHRWLFVEVNHN